jgi:hypothetical protein
MSTSMQCSYVSDRACRGLLLAVAMLVYTSAQAQTVSPAVQSRVVPTGEKKQLGFFSSLNPDCTPAGEISARIVRKPENGTADLDPGLGYANYGQENQRYRCNLGLVEGYRVNYVSNSNFTGHDVFEVEFFTPTGSDVVWKYQVTVK